MSDILTEIIDAKRRRLATVKEEIPVRQIRERAFSTRATAKPHRFIGQLDRDRGINIIAEFKRRSPSKGLIREDAQPSSIARAYERGGAAAISVLTEEDYFGGSLDDLKSVRAAVELPVLRKDFMVDEYQVYESAAAGADALLLIVAALTDAQLSALRMLTEEELRMDALVEVHTKDELKRATDAGAKLIGVNNRNLRTFDVLLRTSIELAGEAPPDVTLISESGLHTSNDLWHLRELGYSGFLIGESLMRADDPGAFLKQLIGWLLK